MTTKKKKPVAAELADRLAEDAKRIVAKKPSAGAVRKARGEAVEAHALALEAQVRANKAQLTANIALHKAAMASFHAAELRDASRSEHIDYDEEITRCHRSLRSSTAAVTQRITRSRKDALYNLEFSRLDGAGK